MSSVTKNRPDVDAVTAIRDDGIRAITTSE